MSTNITSFEKVPIATTSPYKSIHLNVFLLTFNSYSKYTITL